MIARYALAPVRDIWTDEAQYQRWFEVELAAIGAREELGEAPEGTAASIRARASINIGRILEIEARTDHDIVAFVESVTEQLPAAEARWFHTGLTSSDIVDSALAIALRDCGTLIAGALDEYAAALRSLAFAHRDLPTIARTHGVHAEPTSFGLRMLGFLAEAERAAARVRQATLEVSHAKLSGSVGNYANVAPELEAIALSRLGLAISKCATQVVPRDHHAAFLNALSLAGAAIERFALEVRHLQRTEVGEAQEPFRKGQKGSSSMPHKKNPILCERLCGMARLLRAHAGAGMENIALWHERDISHSSIERIILPDATMTAYYMAVKARGLAAELVVRPARIAQNLAMTHNVIYSQRLMIALIDRGMERQAAYEFVQALAIGAWNEGRDLHLAARGEHEVTSRLNHAELDAIFDPHHYLRNVGAVFARFE